MVAKSWRFFSQCMFEAFLTGAVWQVVRKRVLSRKAHSRVYQRTDLSRKENLGFLQMDDQFSDLSDNDIFRMFRIITARYKDATCCVGLQI